MKRLIRVSPDSKPLDSSSLPKVCRYCHHYCRDSKECLNSAVTWNNIGIYHISEEGYLSEVIEEALMEESLVHSFCRSVFTVFDKWGLSKKRKQEFERCFRECYEEFATLHMKEHLDSEISSLYNSLGSDKTYAYISDPDTFCCKDWC